MEFNIEVISMVTGEADTVGIGLSPGELAGTLLELIDEYSESAQEELKAAYELEFPHEDYSSDNFEDLVYKSLRELDYEVDLSIADDIIRIYLFDF